ncbi:uncharacterized protein LOC143298235 [Babylonia areolata]|uniref:uncharacterized protein LOC143298235 n=1 Tax=Babylonia areolata TaxID=304850 RepID=UPI003FD5452E
MPAAVAEQRGLRAMPGAAAAATTIAKRYPGIAGPSVAEGFSADGGGLLFKQVTPRRRQDQFGRDSTRHADYLLSMAVFPTGVRAPLLSELQKKTEHQCGFEVIDRGAERINHVNAATRHVHIRDSRPETVCSGRTGLGGGGSVTDSAKKPPPNTPLTASLKLSSSSPCASDRHPTPRSQSFSVPPFSSRRSLSREKRRWGYSSTEESRRSRSQGRRGGGGGGGGEEGGGGGGGGGGAGDGEKKMVMMKDIRDPLYLNTYCPEERKLRYKKSTLPRLSGSSSSTTNTTTTRARPWTVSEPNPSYRFLRNSQEAADSEKGPTGGKPTWARPGANFRIDARDVMARAKGRAFTSVPGDEGEEDSEDTDSMTGSQVLLEVKSYFHNGDVVVGDQRDSLRGKQGCLHSKVKQCIKFVKYREKLARTTSVERPLKAENGRYRPFSTTTIRTPRTSATHSSPGPRHPDPTSVEIYKEYIDTIALQTRLVSAADKRRKPRPAVSGVPRNNTAASSYQDSVLQSVSDSNRPATSCNASLVEKASRGPDGAHQTHPPPPPPPAGTTAAAGGEKDPDRGREQQQIGGPDPRGVHHALDIIRLSPKAQPPRSSRTARGAGGRSTYRGEEGGEGAAEGGGKAGAEEGEEGKAKTHAIILPNVSKSATTSVCSFMEESVNAAES